MRRAIAIVAVLVAGALALADRPNSEVQTLHQAMGTPSLSYEVSVSTTSAQIGAGIDANVALVPGGAYLIACTIGVHWRVGVGTQTAVTTDMWLPPNQLLTVFLKDANHGSSQQDSIAFITEAGTGKCYVGRRQ